MSSIGQPCERKLWYEINKPELAAPLSGNDYLKFLYGDIIESLMIFLAKLAGHDVKGEQDEVEIEGIKGHRDAIIDGVLVDVKSASPFSYKKFEDGSLKENDAFGYTSQIQSYLYASSTGTKGDELREKDKAYFIAVNKVTGEFCLTPSPKESTSWSDFYGSKKELVAKPEIPPRGFEPEDWGKSGNKVLPFNCGFCAFKDHCWPEIRRFQYANKVAELVVVVKEPLVEEIFVGGEDNSKEKESDPS